jgi:hypothetical protein
MKPRNTSTKQHEVRAIYWNNLKDIDSEYQDHQTMHLTSLISSREEKNYTNEINILLSSQSPKKRVRRTRASSIEDNIVVVEGKINGVDDNIDDADDYDDYR